MRGSPLSSFGSFFDGLLVRHLLQDHAAPKRDRLIDDRIATALAAEPMAGLACPEAAEGGGDVQLRLLKDQHWLAPVASSSSAKAWLVEGWNSR